MSFEHEDHIAALEKRFQENIESRRPEMRRMVQAAVEVENLTGSAGWDYFLSLVQSDREVWEKSRDAWMDKIRNTEVVSQEALLTAKMNLGIADAVVGALDRVLEMPKQVLSDGAGAKKVLAND